jgi:hypothetical protein
MANQSYANGSATVGTTAAKILTIPAENDDIMVQTGSVAVTFGGPGVTATGATAGITVPVSTITRLPSSAGVVHDLYAVAASATSVFYLYPAM